MTFPKPPAPTHPTPSNWADDRQSEFDSPEPAREITTPVPLTPNQQRLQDKADHEDGMKEWYPTMFPDDPTNGIGSKSDFLNSKRVQEQAFAEHMKSQRRTLVRFEAIDKLNHSFQGVVGSRITVTESGLMAAAHRQGAGAVIWYLDFMSRNNWSSGFSEQSLRKFIEYKLAKYKSEGKEPPKEFQNGVDAAGQFSTIFRRVETRLRKFQNVRYRK